MSPGPAEATAGLRDAGRLRRVVPAGVLDAGFGSLATFLVGVAATRVLDAGALGIYALFFSAVFLSGEVPRQLFFFPAEVLSLGHDLPTRARMWARTGRWGVAPSLLTGLVAVGVAVVGAPDLGGDILVPLAVTAVAVATVTSLQDHVRRLLHLAGRSWSAVVVSLVQLVAVATLLVVGAASSIDEAWLPLGALAVANGVSLLAGTRLLARAGAGATPPDVRPGDLTRIGRFHLVIGAAPALAGFGVALLVSRLAGAEALGHAEAARLVAQPLLVLGLGLAAVLGPRAAEAGARHDRAAADAVGRPFALLLLLGAVPYLLYTGWDWSGNVVAALVPEAYAVRGLVAASIVAAALNSLVLARYTELIGARRERRLAAGELVLSPLQCVAAAAASGLDAFARPIAWCVYGGAKVLWYRRVRVTGYGVGAEDRVEDGAMAASGASSIPNTR